MPSLTQIRKSALNQPGFYWKGNGVLALTTDIVRGRIYAALVGRVDFRADGSVDTAALKNATARNMLKLFEAIFTSFPGGKPDVIDIAAVRPVDWHAVNERLQLASPLEDDDVEIAAYAIVAARHMYKGTSDPETPLNSEVDDFIQMQDTLSLSNAKSQ